MDILFEDVCNVHIVILKYPVNDSSLLGGEGGKVGIGWISL